MITKLKKMSKSQWLAVLGATLILAALIMMPFVQAQATGSEQIGSKFFDYELTTPGISDTLGDTLKYDSEEGSLDTAGDISLSKIAEPVIVDGKTIENQFDITLTVTAPVTTTSTSTTVAANSATVLVLDRSSSMNTSIASMKAAANSFIDSYGIASYEDDGTTPVYYSAKRMIAVVYYGSRAEAVSGKVDGKSVYWFNVATEEGRAAAKTAVNFNGLNGNNNVSQGTFMQGGLLVAKSLLDNDSFKGTDGLINGIENRNVILMADGEPTFHHDTLHTDTQIKNFAELLVVNDGGGSDSGSVSGADDKNYAKNVATYLKNATKSNATIFTVLYRETANSAINLMKSIATAEANALQASTAAGDLTAKFNDILNKIEEDTSTSTITGTVTDPMADYINFLNFEGASAGASLTADGFTWELIKENATNYEGAEGETPTSYTYTLKYRVELDPTDLAADQFYPTNKETTFTYGETDSQTTLHFPVPTVKALFANLNFIKVDAATDEPISATATFTLQRTGVATTTTHNSAADGSVTISGLRNGSYTLTETAAPNNYIAYATPVTFDVSFGKISNIQNWPAQEGTTIPANNDDTYLFANSLDQQNTRLTINKVWVGEDSDYRPSSVSVKLYKVEGATETELETIVIQDPWTAQTTSTYPLVNANGSPITYKIVEQDQDALSNYDEPTYSLYAGDGELTVTNTFNKPQIELDVTKNWIDIERDVDRTFSLKLERQAAGSETWETVIASQTFTGSGGAFAIGENAKFDAYDKYGKAYTYKITEVSASGIYTVSYQTQSIDASTITGGSATFELTNTLLPATTGSLAGAKTWYTYDEAVTKPDIRITLVADGEETNKYVDLTNDEAANHDWKYSFSNLDLYKFTYNEDDNSIESITEITYSAKESYLTPGFDNSDWYAISSSTDTSTTDINFSNRYKGSVDIAISKTWDNLTEGHPTISYDLYRDGEQIDAYPEDDSKDAYEFTGAITTSATIYTDLPKYSATGHKYVYDVREVVLGDDANMYNMINKQRTESSDTITFAFTNTKASEGVSISGNKYWIQASDSYPAVTINLHSSASTEEDQIEATYSIAAGDSANYNSAYSFSDLPAYTYETIADTNPEDDIDDSKVVKTAITYWITEEVPAGYTSVYSYISGTNDNNEVVIAEGETTKTAVINITNTKTADVDEQITITVKKEWVLVGDADKDDLTFNLLERTYDSENNPIDTPTGSSLDLATNDSPAQVVFTANKYKLVEGSLELIEYYVSETAPADANYTGTITGGKVENGDDFVFTATNTMNQVSAEIKVAKVWSKPSNISEQGVTFTLYQDNAPVSTLVLTASQTEMLADGSYQYFAFANATGGFDWPTYNFTDNEAYVYTIAETVVPSGFSSETAETAKMANFGENTITNTYITTEHEGFEATKTWFAPEGYDIPAIDLVLYRYTTDMADATEVARKPIAAQTGTVAPITNTVNFLQTDDGYELNKYDAQHNYYHYFVAEELANGDPVPGFTQDDRVIDEEGNYEKPLAIVNRIAQDYINITVIKDWEHHDNESTDYPAEVIVTLAPASATTTGQQALNADNSWEYTYGQLPVYDLTTGQEIAYTVTENNVEYYTSTVSELVFNEEKQRYEFTITNEYDPYLYQLVRIYKSNIGGVFAENNIPGDIQKLTQAAVNMGNLDTAGKSEDPSLYTDYNGLTYNYDATQGTEGSAGSPSVKIIERGNLYQVVLVYTYGEEIPDDKTTGIEIIKTANTGSVTTGSTVNYTLTVNNTGNQAVMATIADDMFDGRATNILVDGVAAVVNAGSIDLGQINAGASVVITYSYTTTVAGTVDNTATVDAIVINTQEELTDSDDLTVTVTNPIIDIERNPDPEPEEEDDIVEIEPDTTPLAPAPIVIEEPTTPLAPAPAEEVLIIEEETPLGNLPQTGAAGISVQMMLAAGIMLLAISGLAIIPKAKKSK